LFVKTTSTTSKPTSKKTKSDDLHHLHVVVDDTLKDKLEAHARKLLVASGIAVNSRRYKMQKLNLSEAVRDLLRAGLGMPRTEADLAVLQGL